MPLIWSTNECLRRFKMFPRHVLAVSFFPPLINRYFVRTSFRKRIKKMLSCENPSYYLFIYLNRIYAFNAIPEWSLKERRSWNRYFSMRFSRMRKGRWRQKDEHVSEVSETSDRKQKIQSNRETNDNSLITAAKFELFHVRTWAQTNLPFQCNFSRIL